MSATARIKKELLHFQTIARELPWRSALEDEHGLRLNSRPTAPGVQTAIVVGPEGEATPGASGPLHTDGLGRLKVKFHWMEQGASCWLRSVQRYAGQGHGAQFLPRIGQEVLVNFMGGRHRPADHRRRRLQRAGRGHRVSCIRMLITICGHGTPPCGVSASC